MKHYSTVVNMYEVTDLPLTFRSTWVPSCCVSELTQRLVTARITFFVLILTLRSGGKNTIRTHVFMHFEFHLTRVLTLLS